MTTPRKPFALDQLSRKVGRSRRLRPILPHIDSRTRTDSFKAAGGDRRGAYNPKYGSKGARTAKQLCTFAFVSEHIRAKPSLQMLPSYDARGPFRQVNDAHLFWAQTTGAGRA